MDAPCERWCVCGFTAQIRRLCGTTTLAGILRTHRPLVCLDVEELNLCVPVCGSDGLSGRCHSTADTLLAQQCRYMQEAPIPVYFRPTAL